MKVQVNCEQNIAVLSGLRLKTDCLTETVSLILYSILIILIVYVMATQLADRGPYTDLLRAKFGPPHFLEFALGVREGTSWGGNSKLI